MSRHFVNNLRVLNTTSTPSITNPVRSWVNGPPELGHKRVVLFAGHVVSAGKMQKTINVEVSQFVRHPIIRKFVRTTTKLMAHDEYQECQYGDVVEVRACRPLSKRKRFVLHRIIKPMPEIDWKQGQENSQPFTHSTVSAGNGLQTSLPPKSSEAPASLGYRARLQKALHGRK